MSKKKACYIWDEKLIEESDRLPAVIGRASMVHNIIEAFNLMGKLTVVRSTPATFEDMKEFHSDLYLDQLKKYIEVDEDYMSTAQDEEFGIGYDCPPVSNMFDLVSCIAGGSVTASRCLLLGVSDVAINWCGGWHHAHRLKAEGFCYVNDIVIAIEKLRKKFPKVLYIDLDVHHGNGVEEAYSQSDSVFTLSFHKYEVGFFPGTGGIDNIGSQGGTGYACNFPLHASYTDDTMEYAFEKVFNAVYSTFEPDAIVTQCGADALARDPNGGATLTTRSYCTCVQHVLDKRKPTLLLGGGGYNHANAARLWASLTALVAGVQLDDQIPEHSDWPQYGPSFTMAIEPTLTKDCNKKAYIEECITKILDHLNKYVKPISEEPATKRTKTEVENVISETRYCHNKLDFRKKVSMFAVKENNDTSKNESKVNDVYEFID
ncbi:histone deacetylase 8-like [Trichoplusia ni]|uniref:Histone deacetylase n=1 Tax=Trichoplusia ni TaxID=7111 RepID=A0A7E5WIX1_TRINI|nr:histone deacetylase 8-like [Trichoplusia ni]